MGSAANTAIWLSVVIGQICDLGRIHAGHLVDKFILLLGLYGAGTSASHVVNQLGDVHGPLRCFQTADGHVRRYNGTGSSRAWRTVNG